MDYTQDENEHDKQIQPSLDDYDIIITDRLLEKGEWALDDITEIDDIYHTRIGGSGITTYRNPSEEQIGFPFKNRFKIVVAGKNRGMFIQKAMSGDILIPRYMYLTKTIFQETGSEKEQYLRKNILIHNRIELPLTNFGLNPAMDNFVAIHIMRVLFNYIVRDYRVDDIIKIVNSELQDIVNELSSTIDITHLSQVIVLSCSDFFETCMLLIAKYDMFKTSVMNYHRINTMFAVIEKIYGVDRHQKGKMRELITIKPSFLMYLVPSGDVKSLIMVIGRILRSSQINRSINKIYEIVSTDHMTELLSSISGKRIIPRIIDISPEMEAHKYLIWVWKRYTFPRRHMNTNNRRALIRKKRWSKIRKIFEHSTETIFSSTNWVVGGLNTIKDTREYVASILLDPITLPYVKNTWKDVYEIYFDSDLSRIIQVFELYAMTVRNASITQISETRRIIIPDKNDISVLIKTGVYGPKEIAEIFKGAIRGMIYYESLKDIIISFDNSLRGTKIALKRPHAITGSMTSDQQSASTLIRPDWIDWRRYRDLSVTYEKSMCHSECKTTEECTDNCVCRKEEDHSVLFCNAYIDTGATLEVFVGSFDLGILQLPLQVMIDFTRAYSRIVMYHHSKAGMSHLLDPINIQSVIYNMYLIRLLSGTQCLNSLISNLNLSKMEFDIDERYFNKLMNKFQKALYYNIDRKNAKNMLVFLIHNLIRTFFLVKEEVEHYYPKIVDNIDYDENSPNRIVMYSEQKLIDSIIEQNDLAGLTRVVCHEVSSPDIVPNLFKPTEITNSIGIKIMDSIIL